LFLIILKFTWSKTNLATWILLNTNLISWIKDAVVTSNCKQYNKWAVPSKKGPYLFYSIWKRQNRKCDVILSALVKCNVIITKRKSGVSSVIDRTIFNSNKYLRGFDGSFSRTPTLTLKLRTLFARNGSFHLKSMIHSSMATPNPPSLQEVKQHCRWSCPVF
jgi:hypothetical protein